MLIGPLLCILQDAAAAMLTITDGPDEEEFFTCRLTWQEVMRQPRIMTGNVGNLPPGTDAQMAEIDWADWAALGMQLKEKDRFEHEAIWLRVRSLMPALLLRHTLCHSNLP